MTNISFTQQELQALLALLDVSVKAGGLQVAGAAVALQQKIMAALEDTNRMMVAQEQAQPDRENN